MAKTCLFLILPELKRSRIKISSDEIVIKSRSNHEINEAEANALFDALDDVEFFRGKTLKCEFKGKVEDKDKLIFFNGDKTTRYEWPLHWLADEIHSQES